MAAVDFYQVLGCPGRNRKRDQISLPPARPEIPSGCESGGQSLRGEVQAGFRGVRGAARPEKRASYDRFGSRWNQWRQAQQHGGATTDDFDSGTEFNFDFSGSDLGDFGTVFETLFGHGAGAGTRQRVDLGGFTPPHPQGYEAQVEISLEEAYSGATRQVRVEGRPLTVNIPKGVATGSRIRLAGGAQGPRGKKQDVYLTVNVRRHPTFTRDGDNLLVDAQVPYYVAALGGEVSVPTMTGRVKMRVPQGVQSGQSLRLTGKGMPKLKGDGNGDLLAKVVITVPKSPSPRERDLLTQIASEKGKGNPGG